MARLTDVRQGCGAAPAHQQSLARDPTRQGTVVLARCASGGRAQGPAGAVALVYYHAAFHHGRGGQGIGVPLIAGTLVCPVSF